MILVAHKREFMIMKQPKALLTLLFLLVCSALHCVAQTYVPRDGEIRFKVLQATKDRTIHQVRSVPFTPHHYALFRPIDLDAAKPSHEYDGLGVSLTDASCWLLSEMDEATRHKLLTAAFTAEGLNLSMIRLNCGASDYATELYNYNDTAGDVKMKNFSVARDEKYMIPIIKSISSYCPDVFTYSSIWSCPGWLKDSGEMCGGSLLDEHLPTFAAYWAAYLKAYKERGVKIDAITIQNEPDTDQDYGCPATLISGKQEAELAGTYMPKAFRAAGVDTKIWIWDHNYDGWQRVNDMLDNERVKRNTAAVAWHPYVGEAKLMQKVVERHPDVKMHLTERGPSMAMGADQDTKWWADVVFDALNNGCSSYSSWNLVLDQDGQPNTGRHPCAGLFTYNTYTGEVTESTQAALFRQFGPYVKRGAKILAIDQPQADLKCVAFQNPEGDYVVVVAAANVMRQRRCVQIKFKGEYLMLALPMNTWSLTTVLIDKQ